MDIHTPQHERRVQKEFFLRTHMQAHTLTLGRGCIFDPKFTSENSTLRTVYVMRGVFVETLRYDVGEASPFFL
jgi:hypothetical protein